VKDESDSLEAQTEAITAWCAEGGHRLVSVHRDDGKSGTLDSSERAGLAAALAKLEAGEAQGLVAHRLDRLGRALHVQEATFAHVWQHDGRHVFSAVEGEVLRDDPDDPYRTAMRQMMGVFAQLERGMIVARMQGGRKRRKQQGHHIGGSVPYGYTLGEDKELVPVPEQQRVVKLIKNLRSREHSFAEIAERLNRKGLPTAEGGRWHAMTVFRVHGREKP
jgi:DNA invertase Pin-like site-specific DNA recombinase